MPCYVCKHCEHRSYAQGRCINCGKSLGSLSAAVSAASVATLIYGAVWIGLALATGMILIPLAMFYGAAVSITVTIKSGGRGILYQLIASAHTVVGMAVADGIIVLQQWEFINPDWGDHPKPDLLEVVQQSLLWDPVTIVCCLVGLAGGFLIWR